MKANEYIVDRLNERISDLEKELSEEKSNNTDILVAEVMLAVVCFVVGCIVGALYL